MMTMTLVIMNVNDDAEAVGNDDYDFQRIQPEQPARGHWQLRTGAFGRRPEGTCSGYRSTSPLALAQGLVFIFCTAQPLQCSYVNFYNFFYYTIIILQQITRCYGIL